MKTSKFQEWHSSTPTNCNGDICTNSRKEGWNGALNKVLSLIKRRNKIFEGNWQHEDVEYLIEDLQEMIEK